MSTPNYSALLADPLSVAEKFISFANLVSFWNSNGGIFYKYSQNLPLTPQEQDTIRSFLSAFFTTTTSQVPSTQDMSDMLNYLETKLGPQDISMV